MIDFLTLAECIRQTRYIFKDAIVAGGAIRDIALGITPKDIDIFVPLSDLHTMQRLVDELNMTGHGFVLNMIVMDDARIAGEITDDEYAAWGRGEGELIGVAEGMWGRYDVNIVARRAHNEGIMELLASFDVGLVQGAFDGSAYYHTEAFVVDLLGQTATLMRNDFPELSVKRFERWIERTNADFTFVNPFHLRRRKSTGSMTSTSRDTSIAAFESIRPHITANAKRILDQITNPADYYETGHTTYELTCLLGIKPQSASARVNELSEKGFIRDSGQRRLTDSGRKAIVWQARP